jgi:DNA-binding transcriptional ArsR family regulator
VLADRNRVKILNILLPRPRPGRVRVREFTDQLDLAQPTVSYHLRRCCARRGCWIARSAGTFAYFRVRPEAMERLHSLVEPGAGQSGLDVDASPDQAPATLLGSNRCGRSTGRRWSGSTRRAGHRQRVVRDRDTELGGVPGRSPAGTCWSRAGRRRRAGVGGAVAGLRPLRVPGASPRPASTWPKRRRPRRRSGAAHAADRRAESAGIWTVQAGIFPRTRPSIALHHACGFALDGRATARVRATGTARGHLADALLLERRGSIE